MSAKPDTDRKLPAGLSPSDEARWWDEHHDYWDKTREPVEVIPASPVRRTKPVNLRLPVDMIDELKREARQRSLPYQSLIRMWLQEKLNAAAHQ